MKEDISYKEIFSKLKLILSPETPFYVVSIIYGIGISILTLAIPISVQSLVNTVSFGILIQPLIILSIILLALLIFSGILKALQTYIVEIFQRHFYARTTLGLSHQILSSDYAEFRKGNPVSLVNRYFEVMTVQKSLTKLLVDGVSIVLQSIVGLLLLAFYHPYFLVFDIILMIMLWLVWALFGRRAIYSAVKESKAKYQAASWFQEIARASKFFKQQGRKEAALERSETKVQHYIGERKKHFHAVFGQTIILLVVYALMSSLILGLGGFLVIKGELTLGQLVAAELIITIILSGFSKAGKYLESFYDLYAGVDKLSQFYDIKQEVTPNREMKVPESFGLEFKDACVDTTCAEFCLNYNFEQGKSYLMRSRFNSLRLFFLDVLQNIIKPKTGQITLGGIEYYDIKKEDIRKSVYIVEQPLMFEGTIRDNLTFGMNGVSDAVIHEALIAVDLMDAIDSFDKGLDQNLLPSGYPLWTSQVLRLEVAKAIIYNPEILVLTDVFDHIEKERKNRIMAKLVESKSTLLVFSHFAFNDNHFDKYLLLDKDKIVECDDSMDLQKRGE